MRLPATTLPYQNSDRELVYNRNLSNCSNFNGVPVYYTTVYYLDNSTLYKRTILNTGQPACAGQTISQQTSCRSGCSLTDVALETNVKSFKIDYFNSPNSNTPVSYSSLGSSGLGSITDASITLTVARPTSGRGPDVEYTNTLRLSINPIVR